MAEEKRIDWVPKKGRGLVTAFSPHNIGELWDSFRTFRHVIIENGAWTARPGDALQYQRTNQIVKHMHIFTKMDTGGAITSKLIHLTNAGVIVDDQNAAPILTASSPYEIFFATVKNRLFWLGVNNDPKVWDGTTLASWGADGPSGVLGYTQFATDSANSKVETGTFTAAGAPSVITRTSGTNFPADPAWVGKTFIGTDGVQHIISTVGGISALTLQDTYTGANGSYIVRYGDRSWSTPPKYAYAYYNPTTGHVTNMSPVLTLSEKDINNVAVFLTGIATNATLNGYGYTKIVLFRTAKDGADMLPLKATSGGTGSASVDADGLITNSGGPLTYQDNDGQDYNLGAVLGIKIGPTENFKCPDGRFMAYWDGRFFVASEAFPWRLFISGDLRQTELGVGEESFPPGNYRDLNTSGDQLAKGMGVVGSSLLISSLKQAYFVGGTDEGNYTLERLSTRGFGVNNYALAEHPGDGSVATASAIYVSRDRRVWRHREGGVITDLGSQIQDKLDNGGTLNCARPYFIKVVRVRKMWLLLLGIAQGDLPMQVFAYDFDQECWYDFNMNDITAFDSSVIEIVEDYVTLVAKGSNPTSFIWTLMGSGTSYMDGGGTPAEMKTQHVDAGDRTAKKVMSEFLLYVSASSQAVDPSQWDVAAEFDEDGIDRPLTYVETIDTPRNAGVKVLRFVYQSSPLQWHSAAFRWRFPFIGAKVFKASCVLKPGATGTSGSPS